MTRVRVAVVGCGRAQGEHYKHLGKRDDVELVGHCDIDGDRAAAAAERHGGEAFTDHEKMYDQTRPAAVYISVPPFAHSGPEEAAAIRGIHLFVEKPIALDRRTAKAIAATIRKAKIITSVGYCWRYFDTVEHARKLIKHKAICLVRGYWDGPMPEAWWWRRQDKSGGQLLEQSTHIVDLVRHLCGEVAEVHAIGSSGCMTQVPDFDIHDSSVATLQLKNGAAGVVTSVCVANSAGVKAGVEIVTPEAVFTVDYGKLTVREDGKTTEYEPRTDIYAEQTEAFVESIKTGRKKRIRSTYADALKTFCVTCAANESMASGLPVKP
ncbi:MAG: Gfo/Idh/MocA family protein [Candidatus Hydrogenedentota bacterium]